MAKKNSIKKFALPPAKILSFNPKGKAIEDIDFRDDMAYLANRGWSQHGCAMSTDLVPYMQFTDWVMDWRAKNVGKSEEEENSAFNALWISPDRPRWVVRLQQRQREGTSTKPTLPAA
jgi:hypothetical protein